MPLVEIPELEQIPLRRGDDVLIHSSMGGAEFRVSPRKLIDSVLSKIGEDGTLLMPLFTIQGMTANYIASDPLFDPKTSPTTSGAINQYFMRRYAIQRSLHPWCSVGALGKRAAFYVSDHHLCKWPFGEKSPLYKLAHRPDGGRILLFGCSHDRNTSYHIIECVLKDRFPIAAYEDRPATMRYLGDDGEIFTMETMVPSRAVSLNKPDYEKFGRYMESRHGNAWLWKIEKPFPVSLIDAGALYAAVAREMAAGVHVHGRKFRKDPQVVRRMKRLYARARTRLLNVWAQHTK